MPIPSILDFDRICRYTSKEIAEAMTGWLSGRPTSEEALLNRLTECLARTRRGCDLGVHRRVTMTSQLALLHRQGPRQTDLYGSDLAVTVEVESEGFLKTAFLQLKKSRDYQARLERAQLEQARVPGIWTRAFVGTADEIRSDIRIRSSAEVMSSFPSQGQTRAVDCSPWNGLMMWLWDWLSCSAGEPSDPESPQVERLLSGFVEKPRPEWEASEPEPMDVMPARSWLLLNFKEMKP